MLQPAGAASQVSGVVRLNIIRASTFIIQLPTCQPKLELKLISLSFLVVVSSPGETGLQPPVARPPPERFKALSGGPCIRRRRLVLGTARVASYLRQRDELVQRLPNLKGGLGRRATTIEWREREEEKITAPHTKSSTEIEGGRRRNVGVHSLQGHLHCVLPFCFATLKFLGPWQQCQVSGYESMEDEPILLSCGGGFPSQKFTQPP